DPHVVVAAPDGGVDGLDVSRPGVRAQHGSNDFERLPRMAVIVARVSTQPAHAGLALLWRQRLGVMTRRAHELCPFTGNTLNGVVCRCDGVRQRSAIADVPTPMRQSRRCGSLVTPEQRLTGNAAGLRPSDPVVRMTLLDAHVSR